MGLGSTAKKLQKVADMADDLYTKMTELKTQLQATQATVEATNDRVDALDRELAQQRALVEALAEERDIDVETVLTDAVIEDAEADPDETDPDDATDSEDAEADAETTN
jgi:septal ring factor EnvC (AmiA/AmiB activator)